jgi:type I restriction-modification system DNA methylase subunit
MSNPAPQLVQKLWNYCHILRDDGLSYGDYVEQLTFLLFLKMADEQAKLTASLLARAFAGKLVPKNPAQEPAEKLLERIRQNSRLKTA